MKTKNQILNKMHLVEGDLQNKELKESSTQAFSGIANIGMLAEGLQNYQMNQEQPAARKQWKP